LSSYELLEVDSPSLSLLGSLVI